MTAFPNLFQPLQLRGQTLRNRIVFGAHTANMAEAGLPGARHLGYYVERARGGAAMIVVEPVPVHASAVLTRGNFRPGTDAVIPHFRKITEAVHAEGAVILHQIYHVGQHGDNDNSFHANWSPSGLPLFHDSDGSHRMSEAEIETVIDGYVQAARRARDAGFDGVELFAAYNALIDQFWTPFNNRRTDRWGGSLENRTRFGAEIIGRIRAMAGDDFIIGMAIHLDPAVPASLSVEATQEVVAWHDDRALIDYVTCGTGSYFDFTGIIPNVFFGDKLGVPYAEALKAVCRHAKVQAESHIRTPENAEHVIAAGQADMVSIVRGQIADPQLANKAKAGRAGDIRPCLSCNQMCWGRRFRDYWISCLVNPSAGREFEWGGDSHRAAEKPRRVLVVGGGPAGMEAARVAAERGHRVVLVEASDKLGGQFRLAGLQPRRAQILDWIAWQERQLAQLQVEVRYNSPLDADEIAAFGADVVILATGSQPDGSGFQRALPQLDQLPGIGRGNVCTAEDVMNRAVRPGKRVLMLDEGGNWKGAGTALYLAEAGHQVTIVTAQAVVAREVERTAADIAIRKRLRQLGAVFHTESAVLEWRGNAAVVTDFAGPDRVIEADTLVIAGCNIPQDELAVALAGADFGVENVGDSVAARSAVMAIYEGRQAGMAI